VCIPFIPRYLTGGVLSDESRSSSDKTGTLTANKLSLNEPYVTEGVDREWLMTVAVLASSHNIKTLDPIGAFGVQLCPFALLDGWRASLLRVLYHLTLVIRQSHRTYIKGLSQGAGEPQVRLEDD
jgi:magnesium-transporting ATPase (P-type)